MRILKKRGLCGGLKRNRMGNKWTNIPRTVMKNGFVCTTNILLFVLAILTSLIVLLLLSPKLLSTPHLADHHHLYSNSQGDVLNENKICESIRCSEGIHSRYPYGIKSVSCETKDECRLKCLESVRNQFKLFTRHGGKGIKNFIREFARRYDSGDSRAGQAVWIKNVTYFYYKQGG